MPLSQQFEEMKSTLSGPLEGTAQSTPSQGLYAKWGKRMLDVFASAIGLLLLLPFFAVVALCIRLSSRGPALYRQMRVGKHGDTFRIVKFRSMDSAASKARPGITVSGDARVTPAGKILRRFKIDELPQLWNVLRGEMSLVGPRPELPKYVLAYSPGQKAVLDVRPGITDPASLFYRNEEELLARAQNPEQFYRETILPDKLARNLRYTQNISLRNDLELILATIASSIFPISTPVR